MNAARQIIASEKQIEIDRLERMQAESLAEELRLWEWGNWSRDDVRSLGYPPCLLRFVARGWPEKDLRRLVGRISDVEGIRIDAAVAQLPFSHRKVVLTIYRLGVPMREVPGVLSWSRHRVDQLHNQALGMLAILLQTTKTA